MSYLEVAKSFGITGEAVQLTGGTETIVRIGDIVLKPIKETSLENVHSPELAAWIAEFSYNLKMDGFRMPQGIRLNNGNWITDEGWNA